MGLRSVWMETTVSKGKGPREKFRLSNPDAQTIIGRLAVPDGVDVVDGLASINRPEESEIGSVFRVDPSGTGYRLRLALSNLAEVLTYPSRITNDILRSPATYVLRNEPHTMFPRELVQASSFLAGAVRRGLLFDIGVAGDGVVTIHDIRRAFVRSSANLLHFEGVRLLNGQAVSTDMASEVAIDVTSSFHHAHGLGRLLRAVRRQKDPTAFAVRQAMFNEADLDEDRFSLKSVRQVMAEITALVDEVAAVRLAGVPAIYRTRPLGVMSETRGLSREAIRLEVEKLRKLDPENFVELAPRRQFSVDLIGGEASDLPRARCSQPLGRPEHLMNLMQLDAVVRGVPAPLPREMLEEEAQRLVRRERAQLIQLAKKWKSQAQQNARKTGAAQAPAAAPAFVKAESAPPSREVVSFSRPGTMTSKSVEELRRVMGVAGIDMQAEVASAADGYVGTVSFVYADGRRVGLSGQTATSDVGAAENAARTFLDWLTSGASVDRLDVLNSPGGIRDVEPPRPLAHHVEPRSALDLFL
jgi:hypothetical protein